MVSVCLLSDALLQHLPSYLGFSYLGRGVSLHGCSIKAQPLLLTLDEGYLLTAALRPSTWDSSSRPSCTCTAMAPWMWGWSSRPLPLALGVGMWGSSSHLPPLASGLGAWGSSSRPPSLTLDAGYPLLATSPDLRCRVAPLDRSCAVEVWYSRPLP